MLGIVAEGGSGPWYIRVLGPETAVEKWEASVEEFLSSLRVEQFRAVRVARALRSN